VLDLHEPYAAGEKRLGAIRAYEVGHLDADSLAHPAYRGAPPLRVLALILVVPQPFGGLRVLLRRWLSNAEGARFGPGR